MDIKKQIYGLLSIAFLAGGCAIENDIPYPIVDGSISAFEVEGQCDADGNSTTQATINNTNRTVTLYVDDSVDLTALRINRLTVSNNAAVKADSTVCHDYNSFPTVGFSSLDDLSASSDTRVDFTRPVSFILQTYQDYEWTVTVEQIINRNIVLENQIGNAVIDDVNRSVVVYVAPEQRLDRIGVTTFQLAGPHGTVVPDPTESEAYDFSHPVTFQVSHGWEETSHEWTVYVYHFTGEEDGTTGTFARATSATISGSIRSGRQPVVEYKRESESSWLSLAASNIQVDGTNYTAELTGLTPGTTYLYQVMVDDETVTSASFDTAPATPLTDGDFDNWHLDNVVWNPWSEGGPSFWDTGNRGATTISTSSDGSNTSPTDDTCNGSGQAALLQTKWVVMKLAAGSIFAGSYVRTDGTNGVLSFGREFSSFPSKLRVHYKYTSSTINRIGEDALESLRGRPDSCHVYVALTDWDEPREIRTRPSERQLFDKNDSGIIAYAELIQGSTVSSWQELDLELEYRATNRTPNYIVVVATASKYGDYFTGGEGSALWLDNLELIYE